MQQCPSCCPSLTEHTDRNYYARVMYNSIEETKYMTRAAADHQWSHWKSQQKWASDQIQRDNVITIVKKSVTPNHSQKASTRPERTEPSTIFLSGRHGTSLRWKTLEILVHRMPGTTPINQQVNGIQTRVHPRHATYRERKCADTTGTVPVTRAGRFQRYNINIFFK